MSPFSPLVRRAVLGFALTCASILPGLARAEMSAAQRTEIEQIVKNYLVTHPEVLKDALTALSQQENAQRTAQSSQAVEANSKLIFNSPNETVLGNPHGKVTLVEFFDYNCPHCRNVLGDMGRLMKENPDLRYVLKDFPILTPQSVEAARVAIALRKQFHGEKFWEFHKALMQQRGLVGQEQALDAARKLGANMKQLAADMKSPEIATNLKEVGQIADAIHVDGTPAFVLGDSVYEGEMTFSQMNPLIANVRKCGKTSCAS